MEDEYSIYDKLDKLDVAELKLCMERGTKEVFDRVFHEKIELQSYDFSGLRENWDDKRKWLHILRNRLIVVWQDAQSEDKVDKDELSEQVAGVSECLEFAGFEHDRLLSLLGTFLPQD